MYFASVVLLIFVLPVGSIVFEALWLRGGADPMFLIGKWFVFWTVGARLVLAGIRQVAQPAFTAESIFASKDPAAHAIVREIGFGNLAMGVLGLASLAQTAWLVPAAIVGGLYYGFAGAGHVFRGNRNFNGQTALVSDLFVLIILGVYVASRAW